MARGRRGALVRSPLAASSDAQKRSWKGSIAAKAAVEKVVVDARVRGIGYECSGAAACWHRVPGEGVGW